MRALTINLHIKNREKGLIYFLILCITNYFIYQSIYKIREEQFKTEYSKVFIMKNQIEKEKKLNIQIERMIRENKILSSKIMNIAEALPQKVLLQKLLQRIKRSCEMMTIKINNIEALQPIQVKDYFNTSIKLQLEGNDVSIFKFVTSMEKEKSYIRINQLSMMKIRNTEQYSLDVLLHYYSLSDELE